MRTIIVYPLPFNIWPQYEELVERFCQTFKEFPPGADYELQATCHWGEPTDKVRELFYGIKTKFVPYYRDGCQIGAQQAVAQMIDEAFIVGLTTHAYFHRAGWLERFLRVREVNGPGLYGTCSSLEGRPHMRTNCYGMDANIWRGYPHPILSREDCSRFECGDLCLSDWYRRCSGDDPMIVYWDGNRGITGPVVNGYRNGNQEQLLVWDRHTQMYADAGPDEKQKLEDLANGKSVAEEPPKE